MYNLQVLLLLKLYYHLKIPASLHIPIMPKIMWAQLHTNNSGIKLRVPLNVLDFFMAGASDDDDDILSTGTLVIIIVLVVFMITFFVTVIVQWIVTTHHQRKIKKQGSKTKVANSQEQENNEFELEVIKNQPATTLTVTVIENEATKMDTN